MTEKIFILGLITGFVLYWFYLNRLSPLLKARQRKFLYHDVVMKRINKKYPHFFLFSQIIRYNLFTGKSKITTNSSNCKNYFLQEPPFPYIITIDYNKMTIKIDVENVDFKYLEETTLSKFMVDGQAGI